MYLLLKWRVRSPNRSVRDTRGKEGVAEDSSLAGCSAVAAVLASRVHGEAIGRVSRATHTQRIVILLSNIYSKEQ
jgi:hypothetical protein